MDPEPTTDIERWGPLVGSTIPMRNTDIFSILDRFPFNTGCKKIFPHRFIIN